MVFSTQRGLSMPHRWPTGTTMRNGLRKSVFGAICTIARDNGAPPLTGQLHLPMMLQLRASGYWIDR